MTSPPAGPAGSRPSRRLILLLVLLAVSLLAAATACFESSERRRTPTAPSTGATAVVTATVAAQPLEAVPATSAKPGVAQYELRIEVTFRETAGVGARITRADMTIVTNAGNPGPTQSVEMALDLAGFGTGVHQFRQLFQPGEGPVSGRWHLRASGIDGGGQAFVVAPLEVPIRFQPFQEAKPASVVLVGAGDIAECGEFGAEATARILDATPGIVFTLGDHVYPHGSDEYFQRCYGPSWGRHRERTRPSPGNHDYQHDNGRGYYSYFGANAGPRDQGYYSYQAGAWHVIALNSTIHAGRGTPQYEWLRADLAANPATCTLAYWHHGLFSSGPNGGDRNMRDAWRLLTDARADVVVSAHDHIYERFAPQDADGRPDPVAGIRSFIVGTGGAALYRVGAGRPNSEVRASTTWGVLRLTLEAAGYSWEFVPAQGGTFRDSGAGQCIQ